MISHVIGTCALKNGGFFFMGTLHFYLALSQNLSSYNINQRLPEQLMDEKPNPKFTFASVAKRLFVWTISMKIYMYATCTVIRMKIKWFSCETFCTSTCSANGSSDGESQVCIMSQAVHQASTHSCFCSRKWLGVFLLPSPPPPHPPGWDASPLHGYPQTLILPVPIYTPEGILRHCESKVSRPRTQYNVSSQGLNPDCLK